MSSTTLIILLPLIAFIINILFGKRWIKDKAHWVAVPAVLLSFALTIDVFFTVLRSGPFEVSLYTWILSGGFKVPLAFQIDQLTCVMLIVVTSVSSLVFIYSVGYMHGDPWYSRYFAYLSLFVFSMLVLVMANNFLLLYFGWEAVGLCSYLLIGFWFEKKSAADAGKKAFIVNRFGDFGFGLGVILVFLTFGSLEYTEVFKQAGDFSGASMSFFGVDVLTLTVICLLLFCGAMGKSAQFPLHTWLPDAMEGPTPVSALIHAATMVTAGVYLVARCNPLFSLSPTALAVVAGIGGFTCLFAATVALVQTDIKRIIAYSTLSQLGYMFLALGVGAYGAAIFHLYTHAYFKALLFLGSGSVIHAMANEMNITKMGGLKKYMPTTYLTFLIASLSIAGIPGLAGFFSKDEILVTAFSSGAAGKFLWLIGTVTALLTAFYSFRLVFKTFHGECRGGEKLEHHLHESPKVMTIPLVILAIGAIGAGWAGIPPLLLEQGNKFGAFLEPVIHNPEHLPDHVSEWIVMALSVIVAVVGTYMAYIFYVKKIELPQKLVSKYSDIYKLLWNKYWFDEIYDRLIVQPAFWLAKYIIYAFSDRVIIEGIVNGIGTLAVKTAKNLRQFQVGVVSFYALVIIFSMVAIISAVIFLS